MNIIGGTKPITNSGHFSRRCRLQLYDYLLAVVIVNGRKERVDETDNSPSIAGSPARSCPRRWHRIACVATPGIWPDGAPNASSRITRTGS